MKEAPERCLIYLLKFFHRLLLAMRIIYLVKTISIEILQNIEVENDSPSPHWMVPTHRRHDDLERWPLMILPTTISRGAA
jgi:hypothetical protein